MTEVFRGGMEPAEALRLPHLERRRGGRYWYYVRRATKKCVRLPDPSDSNFMKEYERCRAVEPERKPQKVCERDSERCAPKPLPDAGILNDLLIYDRETGKLFWRADGVEAMKAISNRGYRRGSLLGRPVLAHRVIWKMITNQDPDTIDHINGDPSDNRLCNLRSVSISENAKNKRMPRNNSSGRVGVAKFRDKWRAQIGDKYLGVFTTRDEAVRAREKANRALGYHENHGRQE